MKEKEIKVEYLRASGPGGQRKNKKETGVRLTHLPTGVSATATERRHRAINLTEAFSRLADRIKDVTKVRKPRKKTTPPHIEREVRLSEKKRRSVRKENRRTIDFNSREDY